MVTRQAQRHRRSEHCGRVGRPAQPGGDGRRARGGRAAVACSALGRRRRDRDTAPARTRALLHHGLGPAWAARRGARLRRRGVGPWRSDDGLRASVAPRRSGVHRRARRQPCGRPRRRAGHGRRFGGSRPRGRGATRRDQLAAGVASVRPRRVAARGDGGTQRCVGSEHLGDGRRPPDAQLSPRAHEGRTVDPVRQPARAPAARLPRRHRADRRDARRRPLLRAPAHGTKRPSKPHAI